MSPAQFRFEHLTVDEGLSPSDAMAVAQAPAGFIWVGTSRGLDRYNRYGLRHYLLPPLPGRPARLPHQGGALPPRRPPVVGTDRAGLSCYDRATDHLVPLHELPSVPVAPPLRQLAGATIMALATAHFGGSWVATQHSGLYRLKLTAQGQLAELPLVPIPGTAAGKKAYLSSLSADATASA